MSWDGRLFLKGDIRRDSFLSTNYRRVGKSALEDVIEAYTGTRSKHNKTLRQIGNSTRTGFLSPKLRHWYNLNF